MKTLALKGTAREVVGKKSTKAVRNADAVPCVLYGGGENIHFELTNSELRKLIYTPEIYLVELNIGGKMIKAVMKDAQFHPVKDHVLHVDFYQVNETKPIVMAVPVKLEGLAEGVKAGGKLSLEMRRLKVKGLYNNIPESLKIDITNLGLGKTIQVGALAFENLEIVNPKEAVVCAVKLTIAARGAAAQAAAANK
ncbi:MAG: 50S ribosomal protein L25/general stress protein Ctc [Prevotellaceae bacterium]|jgi:large subunit ribosomal protein L25|nr:50S ribosomal protein L25/general stress protein Ctc [Prevotellaceae bacterium]